MDRKREYNVQVVFCRDTSVSGIRGKWAPGKDLDVQESTEKNDLNG